MNNIAPLSIDKTLAKTSLDTKDCYCERDDGICSDVTVKIAEHIGVPGESSKEKVDNLKKKYNCHDESCVLEKNISIKIAGRPVVEHELETKFKVKGPKNTTALLSNYDIDKSMQLWTTEFKDFYPCHFAMMDFARTQEDFETIDLCELFTKRARDGHYKRLFACVLNTDVSTGPGKHWVSCVVDARDIKNILILYYNSAGNPPPEPVVRWMERRRKELAGLDANAGGDVEIIPVTRVRHQNSNTECGVYSLYFVRCMVEGQSYKMFFDNIITDAAMTSFRKLLFR